MYDDHANRVNPDRKFGRWYRKWHAHSYITIHFDVYRSLTLVYHFNFFYRLITLKKYKNIKESCYNILKNYFKSFCCLLTRLFVITRNLFFCNSCNKYKTIVAFKLFHVMFVLRSINWFWREVINDNKRIFIYIVKRFDSIELKQKRRELNDEIKDSWDIPL